MSKAVSEKLNGRVRDDAEALAPILGLESDDLQRILGAHVRKVSFQDRDDLLGSMVLRLIDKSRTTEKTNGSWAYTLCHNYLVDWYRNRNNLKRSHEDIGEFGAEEDVTETLQSTINGTYACDEATTEWRINYDLLSTETMIGQATYQATRPVDESVECDDIMSTLPGHIRIIVNKRMIGTKLLPAERVALHRYLKANPRTV